MTLKVILASLLLFGLTQSRHESNDEYDLINYLVCELTYESINENFIEWDSYNSYESLNPKNLSSWYESKIDLDSMFNDNQRKRIDDFLKKNHQLTLELDLLKCNYELNNLKGFVPKKTIYSYSYPIISKGNNNEVYGIILESVVFKLNYTLKYKIYKKQCNYWDLIYQRDIAFS